jgi:uncharacterized protein (TIGR00661 family)
MLPSDIQNKKVIISPLDWGMGHTTRCIPIIKTLLANGNELLFAGNSIQNNLIQKDFPKLKTILFEGYGMKLDSKKSTYIQMILQSAKMRTAIKDERQNLTGLLKTFAADIVISDNRYGFYAENCTNIILTHQLNLPVPLFQKAASMVIQSYVNKFDFCWIPDSEENPLTGTLARGDIKIPKIYIGLLSRFKKENSANKYKYVAIISGPEPERGRFTQKILNFFANCTEPTVIVGTDEIEASNSTFIKNPSTKELEKLIHESETVISRAGYTTLMELISINKKAVLIPTKGQYEQEYLSKTIKELNIQFKLDEKILAI